MEETTKEHELHRESVRLGLCGRTGKILSLQAHDRQWLVAPAPGAAERLGQGSLAQAQRFTIEEAWGADDCFPSVGGISQSAAMHVRDHGEIWGRTCTLERHEATMHTCAWTLPLQATPVLRRRIELLPGAKIAFELTFPDCLPVEGCGPHLALESLYAFHALFQMETGSKLLIHAQEGETLLDATFAPADQPSASKFYAMARSASLVHSDGSRCHVTNEAGLPAFGIWWCNNGWGDGRPHRTLGLEPTTHPSDGPVFTALPSSQGAASATRRVAFRLEFFR